MSATVETISNLQRRITVSVPLQPIQEEMAQRISRLARTVKLSGFRPGKVPLKLVQQQYGAQVRDEVLSNTVEKTFTDAVNENKLRVAGFPDIEHKPFAETEGEFQYVATFEVFPEVVVGDLSKIKIERAVVELTDADVQKTIDVLVKQRATFEPVKRASKKGDRINISLTTTIAGEVVETSGPEGINLVVGEDGRVEEFEAQLTGNKPGSSKTFEITYPEDHNPPQLAGKTVSYEVTFNTVAQPVLPPVDEEFARSLGVADGDVEKMRGEIRDSLMQEVDKRVRGGVKEQVFQALLDNVEVELPNALIAVEVNRLMEMAKQNLQQRGVDVSTVNLDPAVFEEQAKRNTKLRLILSELVSTHSLHATAEQVRAMVDQFGQSFEQPEEVVRWYYADVKRLDEPAALATEENVVAWVLATAKVSDKKTKFDALMGRD
ncbi:trigger factor [Pseudomethylobacillus aquaticus]|uniref:Trigger factor n=1 Tax=Pseudomethylobacillus aquaticus TaxID=2676064 RepID=A0A3N0V5T9_9PROT|nr:trigger factor [Pseudomethylobacillus aquaticus]ROH87944.1 trigger factor [Pseudomethylobacillus aquaticus]